MCEGTPSVKNQGCLPINYISQKSSHFIQLSTLWIRVASAQRRRRRRQRRICFELDLCRPFFHVLRRRRGSNKFPANERRTAQHFAAATDSSFLPSICLCRRRRLRLLTDKNCLSDVNYRVIEPSRGISLGYRAAGNSFSVHLILWNLTVAAQIYMCNKNCVFSWQETNCAIVWESCSQWQTR